MKVCKKTEGEVYDAADHFNMWGVQKIKGVDSERTIVSLSHFLPNGSASMKPSAAERVYYVVSGSITVSSESEDFVLDPGDLIYIPPNENRAIKVNNNEPATILVVVVKV